MVNVHRVAVRNAVRRRFSVGSPIRGVLLWRSTVLVTEERIETANQGPDGNLIRFRCLIGNLIDITAALVQWKAFPLRIRLINAKRTILFRPYLSVVLLSTSRHDKRCGTISLVDVSVNGI